MTENMAGRGEGLAGLVTKWDRERHKPRSPAVGRDFHEGYSMGLRHCASELETALEAAAPASTAPRQVTSDCLDQLREMLDRKDLSGADLYALNEAITALATPSPQAPRPDCELLSSPNSVLAFDDELNPEPEDTEAIALVAQEPAGSGAQEKEKQGWTPSTRDIREIREKFNAYIPGTEPKGPATPDRISKKGDGDALLHQVEQASGSPRKVGEDGALKVGDKVFVRGEVEYIDESSDGVWMGVKVSGHTTTMEFAPSELARPSSVPVGEQKQEEGV